MAQITTETIEITVSKLFKSGVSAPILSDEQLETLREVVEATVAELLADPTIVVEVVAP